MKAKTKATWDQMASHERAALIDDEVAKLKQLAGCYAPTPTTGDWIRLLVREVARINAIALLTRAPSRKAGRR